jgi:hypothetical protein
MRGVLFPNSNLIFTVQTHDPAEKPPAPKPDAQANGFSWVDWGAGIYGGWQLIDNAAIAIADVSPLLLNPGLRCENGREAPVADADWIKFTQQMIAVSKQMYRLSQDAQPGSRVRCDRRSCRCVPCVPPGLSRRESGPRPRSERSREQSFALHAPLNRWRGLTRDFYAGA